MCILVPEVNSRSSRRLILLILLSRPVRFSGTRTSTRKMRKTKAISTHMGHIARKERVASACARRPHAEAETPALPNAGAMEPDGQERTDGVDR